MPATPNYDLPYPSLGDPPDGPGQLQALADAVEGELARIDGDVSSLDGDVSTLDGRVSTLENDTEYGEWQTATLLNGWIPRSTAYAPAYRLIPGRRVELRGSCISGTKASGTVLWTMPAEYRPSSTVIITVTTATTGSDLPRILIDPSSGDVQLYGQSSSDTGATHFDGATYSLG